MKKMIYLLIVFNFILINSVFGAITATIENSADPSTNLFTVDDILELKIISEDTNNTTVDFSKLQQNFIIISQAQQVYHSIINGKASSKIQWTVSLQPQSAGNFTIPPLSVGKEMTKAIDVVIKPVINDPNKTQEIFINTEADNQSVYINSPLKLSINVFVSTDITARNLQLNTPESTEFTLFKISEDNKQSFYKNKRYQLYQVQYLIFFNNAGNISLPKFNLTGLKLKDTSRSQDILSLYQQQWIPFNRSSNPLTINVLAKPSSYGDQKWLTADELEVKQLWSNSGSTINSGDALQRTIVITAQNTPAANLPTLIDPQAANLQQNNYKMYVDKPELNNEIRNNKLYSTAVQKITYIPTAGNILQLPEFNLTWWNNSSKSKVETPIKGKTYQIIGTTANVNSFEQMGSTQISENNPPPAPVTTDDSSKTNSANTTIKSSTQQNLALIYLLLALVAVLSLITIGIYLKYKKLSKVATQYKTTEPNLAQADKQNQMQLKAKIKDCISQLNTQASNQDLSNTYKSLGRLADLLYPQNANSMQMLKRQMPENCQKEIEDLQAALYSPQNVKWDHANFSKIITPCLERHANAILASRYHAPDKKHDLPTLYPDT